MFPRQTLISELWFLIPDSWSPRTFILAYEELVRLGWLILMSLMSGQGPFCPHPNKSLLKKFPHAGHIHYSRVNPLEPTCRTSYIPLGEIRHSPYADLSEIMEQQDISTKERYTLLFGLTRNP